MMDFESIRNALPDFAKDIKLNLGNILTETGAPGLTNKQIASIALASAYTIRCDKVIAAATQYANTLLSAEEINGTKAAAVIMAMNNIYYRFIHIAADKAYSTMPANLRMNIMANPGIDKTTFELASLAVSALNGCGMCINSHAAQLEKHGVSKEAIQSTVRIASVINAAAMALSMN